MSRNLDLCGSTCSMLQTSTLPLREESIMHHSKFVPEEQKLSFNQGFSQNIYNMLIYGNILKLDFSLLDHVPYEVIPNLNILVPFMEYWILKDFETTMIITIYHCGIQLLIKYTCKQFVNPNGFIASHTHFHLLYLC
jgi:hypothetical protein